MKAAGLGLIILSIQSLFTTAHAEDVLHRDYLTGNWGGQRDRLEQAGITPALTYTTDVAGNPFGGKRQDLSYAAQLGGSMSFDFEKLFGTKGLSFYAGGNWAGGTDLTTEAVGNLFQIQQVFAGRQARLVDLYLEQSLANDRYNIALGRLSSGADFAALDLFGDYVSAGINGNPGSIGDNLPAFTAYPRAQWGIRGNADIADGWEVTLGAYNADLSPLEDSNGGTDFSLRLDRGVLTMAQLSYSWNDQNSTGGLPGKVLAGGYGDSSKYAKVDDEDEDEDDEIFGNYGFYAIGQQQLTRETSDRGQGLTAWAALTVNPDQTINPVPLGLFAGLLYQGLFPNRDNDTTAFGLFYASFSEDLEDQDFELAMEINHRFQATPWLYIQPMAQYIIHPDGDPDIENAGVLGFELSVTF
ncbi:carbohydrate porin [Roseibium sp. RKSG952]|uniref:carbohydrate porin n=1 Tax=Roseibium sp. RKSG952 TaxID=2529384 RepID=UPI0018AD11F8|nr:carbohydrate porin [Roseibium sp. RKSG952]